MKIHCTNSHLFCNYFGYICNCLIASIRVCNYDNMIICGSYEIGGLQTNLCNNKGNWKCFITIMIICVIQVEIFCGCNANSSDKCIKRVNNLFIAEIINAWCSITFDENPEYTCDHIIWNNSLIKISNVTIYKMHGMKRALSLSLKGGNPILLSK